MHPPFNAEALEDLRESAVCLCTELLTLHRTRYASGRPTVSALAAVKVPTVVADTLPLKDAPAADATAEDSARVPGVDNDISEFAMFEEQRDAAVAAVLLQQASQLARHLPAFVKVVSSKPRFLYCRFCGLFLGACL